VGIVAAQDGPTGLCCNHTLRSALARTARGAAAAAVAAAGGVVAYDDVGSPAQTRHPATVG